MSTKVIFLKARIDNWKYDRSIRIFPNKVGIQVTVPKCSHCRTCQRRSQYFKDMISCHPDVKRTWKWHYRSEWLYIDKNENQDGLKVLGNILQISIWVNREYRSRMQLNKETETENAD